jgi:hypothetical protein
MFWLAIAATAVLLLIVAALAVPVQFDVQAELSDRWRGRVTLRWLFGLLEVPLTGGSRSARPPRTRKPRKPSRRRPSIRPVLATPGLAGRTVEFLEDLVTRIQVRAFQLKAEFGVDDPADTGQIYGALVPVLVLASVRGMDVRCRPDFTRARLEGACTGSVSVRPLAVFGVVVRFLLSPPVRHAWRQWRHAS